MEAQHRCWPVGFFPLSRSFASSTPQLLPRSALIFPSQVWIVRFATSSTVTCFLFCFKCFLIRSASCVVFGISQGCSLYRARSDQQDVILCLEIFDEPSAFCRDLCYVVLFRTDQAIHAVLL